MTFSRYHQRKRRETQFILAVETICESLKAFLKFNEPTFPWWLADMREAA